MLFEHIVNNAFKIKGEPFTYRLSHTERKCNQSIFVFISRGREKREIRVPRGTLNKYSKCYSTSFCEFIENAESIQKNSDIWVLRNGRIIFSRFIELNGNYAQVELYSDERHFAKVPRNDLIAYAHKYENGKCRRCGADQPRVKEVLHQAP